jgi:hypothetical protein
MYCTCIIKYKPQDILGKEKNDFKVCQNIECIAIGRKRRVKKSKPWSLIGPHFKPLQKTATTLCLGGI